MKTMTVSDIHEHWAEAESALAVEKEIIITRNGHPVAKLTQVEPAQKLRARFDFEEHRRWKKEVFGTAPMPDWVQKFCTEDRAERI